jgi:hypothetical protein
LRVLCERGLVGLFLLFLVVLLLILFGRHSPHVVEEIPKRLDTTDHHLPVTVSSRSRIKTPQTREEPFER